MRNFVKLKDISDDKIWLINPKHIMSVEQKYCGTAVIMADYEGIQTMMIMVSNDIFEVEEMIKEALSK